MPSLVYTPDEDVKVHEEGAIRLICKSFQSHESGLPEWLKNSADEYARQNTPELIRVIVVILNQGRKGTQQSIACLDFSGMTSEVIEENFRVWADPDAARRGRKSSSIQGGHGNGGKCYMTQIFQEHSLLNTVKRRKGCKYGVVGGSVRFGYIPNREKGRDFPVPDSNLELERLLGELGCSVGSLPKAAMEALKTSHGFTLIRGVGPKGYDKTIPVPHLIESLEEHPQMLMTLEFCKVYVVADGKVQNNGKPLSSPEIEPLEGVKEPRNIVIPQMLKDPLSDQNVSTTDHGKSAPGSLRLLTSQVSMRWSKKGRHNVIFKAISGFIGYIQVPTLDIQSPKRDHIYGECCLEALEEFKQNERGPLANSPLTRAVERFISLQIESYAKEFELRDRRKYAQREKDAISKMNEALDRWKNRFLGELMRGTWGPGIGPTPPSTPLPAGKPATIELGLSHSRAGVGVAFRPTLKFFDKTGQRIRPVPYRWVSEDTNVAMVDDDLLVINTFSVGQTVLYAETLQGGRVSNKVPLEVIHIEKIRISPLELEISTSNRCRLEAICQLTGGEETSDVYLEWVESDSNIVRVSSAGLVYGFAPGQTEVTAGDDVCTAKEPCIVKVAPGQGLGRGKQSGRGFPLVQVSGEGFDRDPDTKEYVLFGKDDPPVAQRPQDTERNIWWINSSAPFAAMFLDASKGYGSDSLAWRMYHLERFIDVIVQIALTHGPNESETLSPGDWIVQWGFKVAEIQAAAVADLSVFIETGELPKG